jgi:tetratricopeptide (TPR) repeat protein
VENVLAHVGGLLGGAASPDLVHADALVVRGAARAAAGDVDAGRDDVARARSLRADLGHRVGWAVTAQIAARVELLAGEPERAEALLREGSDQLRRLGETGYLSTNEGMRALILADLGRLEDAAAAAETCRRSAPLIDVTSQALWRSAEALLLSRRGRHADAMALAREACALREPTDAIEDTADALMVLAGILVAAGDADAARQELGRAADLYERKGDVVSAPQARALLAEPTGTPPAR